MTDYFSYNDGKGIVPDGAFRISPSQVSRYFDQTSQWYREFLLGEKGFQGSTASELGTIVHAAAAMYFDHQCVYGKQIEDYLDSITDPEIDKSIIREQYPIMIETLINEFLSTNLGTHSEQFLWHEVLPGIGVGGSIDNYDKNKATITDFKTMGSLDKARLPKSFPRAYWFQQMLYAWLMIKNGFKVDYVRLAFVTRNNTGRFNDKGKALKDYPSEVYTLIEQVTDESLEIIDGCVNTIAHSVQLWQNHPELRFALAQDWRLRAPEKPKLFKD